MALLLVPGTPSCPRSGAGPAVPKYLIVAAATVAAAWLSMVPVMAGAGAGVLAVEKRLRQVIWCWGTRQWLHVSLRLEVQL